MNENELSNKNPHRIFFRGPVLEQALQKANPNLSIKDVPYIVSEILNERKPNLEKLLTIKILFQY